MKRESVVVSSSTVESPDNHCDGKNEDEIPGDFPEIDHISLYTLGIYFYLGIPLLLSAGFTMSYVFTAGIISYRSGERHDCEDPVNTTLYPSWLSNAVPYVDDEPTTCTRYTVLNSTDSCSTTVFTNEVERCDAWVYDSEEITIQNEWDLTCSNNTWKLALPGTINSAGLFIGLIYSGYLSDKYGRRNVLTMSTLGSTILGIIRAFSINYEMFIALEFLDAMAGSVIYSAGFLLGMEFVGPTKRVLVSNVICCMYALGQVILALCSMWLRNWRHLTLVYYAPGLLIIFLPCLVPESIRWLLSKGRVEEAEAVLCKIAARNGVQVSEKSTEIIRNWEKDWQERKRQKQSESMIVSTFRQVSSNRIIFVRLITCTMCWMATTFVYYGLSLSSVNVPGNKYMNFILVAIIEIPGQFMAWLMVDYVGRKPTVTGSFLLSGVFCIVTIFIPEDWPYVPLIVFLVGKLCITVAFSAIYVYTAEIFPTTIRHSLLGFCSMMARVGSMLAPQVPQLEVYMTSLPLLLFGIVAIAASALSLHFPETLGIKLPDTIYEATRIGKVKKEVKTEDSRT